jgi:hypothetical protein
MKTIDEKEALMLKILALELQQARELLVLKEQLKITYESVKPLNFLKSTFHSITTSPDVKNDLINGATNMTSYFMSTNPILSTFQKPIKKVISTALHFLLKQFVNKKQ